jgi:hypothetical protein
MSEFCDAVRQTLRAAGFVEMDTPAAVSNGCGFMAQDAHAGLSYVHVWAMTPHEVSNADAPDFTERRRLHGRYRAALEAGGLRVEHHEGEGMRVRGVPESVRPYSYLFVRPAKKTRKKS